MLRFNSKEFCSSSLLPPSDSWSHRIVRPSSVRQICGILGRLLGRRVYPFPLSCQARRLNRPPGRTDGRTDGQGTGQREEGSPARSRDAAGEANCFRPLDDALARPRPAIRPVLCEALRRSVSLQACKPFPSLPGPVGSELRFSQFHRRNRTVRSKCQLGSRARPAVGQSGVEWSGAAVGGRCEGGRR